MRSEINDDDKKIAGRLPIKILSLILPPKIKSN